MFFRRKKKKYTEINPEDIFIDAHNMPSFDTQQFEGKLEQSISKRSVYLIGFFFAFTAVVFISKLYSLQIERGSVYAAKSDNNTFKEISIFSDRGLILDRNGQEIAWNEKLEDEIYPERKYVDGGGFAHILGYVSYPKKDAYGYYWQDEYIGEYGIEKLYNDTLSGENGAYLYEFSASEDGEVVRSEVPKVIEPVAGENITLSIDKDLQSSMYTSIKDLADRAGYVGGAGVVMDIYTGELIVLTSYPEFDGEVMSSRRDTSAIRSYEKDKRKPFLNRAVGGLYTPGSTVKPFVAIGALNENLIDPKKQIFSSGKIELVSPYDKNVVYTYKDNKAHGWVDMERALAVSSNVYFYYIGGGFEDQEGLGIRNINYYTNLFGLDEKTDFPIGNEQKGEIPSPEWKAEKFDGDIWRIGDTYNTSIGQYGFLVTPISLMRSIAAIASDGILVKPKIISSDETVVVKEIDISSEDFAIVKNGMHRTTKEGTAQLLSYLPFDLGVKTGTAQVGVQKKEVNSWIVGFFPYENPQYAFAILMERGPRETSSATNAAHSFFTYVAKEKPEYVGLEKEEILVPSPEELVVPPGSEEAPI